jgi:hypothetical protein
MNLVCTIMDQDGRPQLELESKSYHQWAQMKEERERVTRPPTRFQFEISNLVVCLALAWLWPCP